VKEKGKRDQGYDSYLMTQTEVGQELGVSREAVSQIEKRAFAKIRRILKKRAGRGDPRDILPD
jgi:DNA-directed RNA polymerase sigma subunit (sigma70/sigma32)